MERSLDIVPGPDGGSAVTVMRLSGELDASNYRDLIAQVQELYDNGARRLLLDLSDVSFLSSAGLVALHSAVLIMRGQAPPDLDEGWNVFHAISNDVDSHAQPEDRVRILRPQARVTRALEMSGFSRLIPNFDDEQRAIASFGDLKT
jgi:hypothetical protein